MSRFTRFAAIDWSGESVARPKGLALAIAEAGGDAAELIRPEGGWSQKDRVVLHQHGFSGLRLGPRVLRTETAGLAAIAAMQARFGDF